MAKLKKLSNSDVTNDDSDNEEEVVEDTETPDVKEDQVAEQG